MKKSALRGLDRTSQEYVVAHARWQKSRGRRPSMSFRGIRNPREALDEAEFVLSVFGTAEEQAASFGLPKSEMTSTLVIGDDIVVGSLRLNLDAAEQRGFGVVADEAPAEDLTIDWAAHDADTLQLVKENLPEIQDLLRLTADDEVAAACDDYFPNNHF